MMLYQCICGKSQFMLDQFRLHIMKHHGIKINVDSTVVRQFFKTRKLRVNASFECDTEKYHNLPLEEINSILVKLVVSPNSQPKSQKTSSPCKRTENQSQTAHLNIIPYQREEELSRREKNAPNRSCTALENHDATMLHAELHSIAESVNAFMSSKTEEYLDVFKELEYRGRQHLHEHHVLAEKLENLTQTISNYGKQMQSMSHQFERTKHSITTELNCLESTKSQLKGEIALLLSEKQELESEHQKLSRLTHERREELEEAEKRKQIIIDFIYSSVPNLIK